MKNNYDLILSFETRNEEPLSEENINEVLDQARYLAVLIEHYVNVNVRKTIISQAVDGRRLSLEQKKTETRELDPNWFLHISKNWEAATRNGETSF